MLNYKIYIHKNKINGKIYVGQTKADNIKRRFRGGAGYKGSSYFYSAIQKYGWDNFETYILEENLTIEQADLRERYWIEIFDANNPEKGYNISKGGKTKPPFTKNLHQTKKVQCLETGEIFNSLVDAAFWAGLKRDSASNITEQIKGKRPSAGKHPDTGEPLHWAFPGEPYIIKERQKPFAKKVINLDTNEVFDSISEAAKAYGVCVATISKSCKSANNIPVGKNKGKKYRWAFMN